MEATSRFYHPDGDGPRGLNEEGIKSVLGFGSSIRSPNEMLLGRLCRSEGERWFLETVQRLLPVHGRVPPQAILEGSAPVADLVALKEAGKDLLERAKDGEGQMEAAVLYLVAIAGARAHGGRNITSRPGEFEAVAGELAALAPAPWGALFEKALEAGPEREPERR